ncbi:acetylcholinesterase-like [Pecten maximus]|uniref:acetylcholinesterase-like n=1 Tax=Pecten maximus TaxID=6579 RepID=UPI001458A0FC|nr:acetylcholinesterase-like [Pecten maximus]XP_033748545.1 acetylcholinesterase-like [Pecten maximus]
MMTASKWLLQVICVLAITSTVSRCMETKTIVTPSGKMMGLKVDTPALGSFVYQFRRIPYAKPPVGDLRFAKPQPMAPWTDTLNATYFGPNCMQTIINPDDPLLPNKILSEDCLVLNVYMPPNTTESSKKPVMLYIHGGSYVEGTGMFYDGSYLSIHGDQIIVTINYRLGIWGFLTTADVHCPGNFGLWDQRLAIQWTKNNIQAFGGDPDLITIFGESAGGFSVGIHSISPVNKGLFKRAMSHSGTANSFFAVTETSFAKLSQIGTGIFLKCLDVENSVKFLKCMRTKSSEELLDASVKIANITFSDKHNLHYALPLAPVVDGEFITDNPAKVLNDPSSPGMQLFRSIDFVDGDVNSEGSLIFQEPLYSFQKPNHFNLSEGIPYRILCDDVIETMVKEFFHNNRTLKDAACSRYKSPSGDGIEQSRLAVDIYSDIFFFTPGILTLNAHVGGAGRTYQWLLSRMSRFGFGYPYPKWFTGAGHAGEIAFLFGIERWPDCGPQDKTLAEQMMSYWSNFARTGNPNKGLAVKMQWPEYNVQDRRYISLNATISTEEAMYKDRVGFWASVLPKA